MGEARLHNIGVNRRMSQGLGLGVVAIYVARPAVGRCHEWCCGSKVLCHQCPGLLVDALGVGGLELGVGVGGGRFHDVHGHAHGGHARCHLHGSRGRGRRGHDVRGAAEECRVVETAELHGLLVGQEVQVAVWCRYRRAWRGWSVLIESILVVSRKNGEFENKKAGK